MKNFPLTLFAITSFLTPIHALAYGTVHFLGQDAEHERITRRAYACSSARPADVCFQKRTLDELAGRRGAFGGVGLPDKPSAGLMNQESAHCDGGDFLNLRGYPHGRGEARAAISKCRDWMRKNFTAAVAAAAGLLDSNGSVIPDQARLSGDCIEMPDGGGSAKCAVLTHFGVMLHAVQDFYAHSNWADRADAAKPMGPRNPPGLGQADSAAWLRMPSSDAAFPDGLITGCYEGIIERANCNYRDRDRHKRERVKHAFLNKDRGAVDPAENDTNVTSFPEIGKIGRGKTGRGKVNGNFERSVNAAILDTKAKLLEFRAALSVRYGDANGELMFCVLTKDDPAADCSRD